MKEIEIKILEINPGTIEKQLKGFGAEKTFSGDVKVVFFDFEDRRLRNEKKRFRLRDFGEWVEITFKHKRRNKDAIVADEFEILVDDFKTAKKIFLGIGLIEVQKFKKHRTSLAIGDVYFEIDKVGDCPAYMEIEAPSIEQIHKWVKKLGFKKSDISKMSGREVIEYYKDCRG